MKHNKIDRALFSDIKEKFAEFKNINRLATHYKVDYATVKKVLIEFGLDLDYYKKQEEEQKKQAIEYYCLGNNLAKCCSQFNISRSKLTLVLKKLNLLRLDQQLNLTCELCKATFNNKHIFSKHLRDVHKTPPKQYYDTFCKKSGEGCCAICDKETVYIGLIAGYKPTCSHVCGAKFHRRNLKNNPKKHQKFVNKVSSNLKYKHANMSIEEKMVRLQKIATSQKIRISMMTDEERRQKHGWMNKLSKEEKQKFIQNVLLKKGCHLWRKTSSKEEKEALYEKRRKTMCGQFSPKTVRSEFIRYRRLVCKLTEATYKKFKHEINPTDLPRKLGDGGYHVDHKYSVFQGFVDGIPAEIIACKHNLQMLLGSTNICKGVECSITKESLLTLYEKEFKV